MQTAGIQNNSKGANKRENQTLEIYFILLKFALI